MAGPTVSSVFNRLDVRPKDGTILKDEVKQMVKDAGVGGGIFGGTVINMATDALMDQFDADKNGKIPQEEFGKQLYGFLKQAVVGDGPAPEPGKLAEKALEWFQEVDTNQDGKVSVGELKVRVQAELEKAGQSFPGTKADAAAKIGVYLLDGDGDGKASREEVESLARDVETQGGPQQPPPEQPEQLEAA